MSKYSRISKLIGAGAMLLLLGACGVSGVSAERSRADLPLSNDVVELLGEDVDRLEAYELATSSTDGSLEVWHATDVDTKNRCLVLVVNIGSPEMSSSTGCMSEADIAENVLWTSASDPKAEALAVLEPKGISNLAYNVEVTGSGKSIVPSTRIVEGGRSDGEKVEIIRSNGVLVVQAQEGRISGVDLDCECGEPAVSISR